MAVTEETWSVLVLRLHELHMQRCSRAPVRHQAGLSPVSRGQDLLHADCPDSQGQQDSLGRAWAGLCSRPGLGQVSSVPKVRGVSTSPALKWATSTFKKCSECLH